MADIIDEHGNPIQLTDEQGQQVRLTDEHGVAMHLTGVAEPMMHGGTHFSAALAAEPTDVVGGGVGKDVHGGGQPVMGGDVGGDKQQLGKTGSSSSSSSEENDNGEGGRRRKKKGLIQKIKEKLPGHKNKDEQEQVYTATTKVTVTTPAGPIGELKPEHIHVEHHEEEHEKKGLIDKIKDKLPGSRHIN